MKAFYNTKLTRLFAKWVRRYGTAPQWHYDPSGYAFASSRETVLLRARSKANNCKFAIKNQHIKKGKYPSEAFPWFQIFKKRDWKVLFHLAQKTCDKLYGPPQLSPRSESLYYRTEWGKLRVSRHSNDFSGSEIIMQANNTFDYSNVPDYLKKLLRRIELYPEAYSVDYALLREEYYSPPVGLMEALKLKTARSHTLNCR